MPKVSRDAIISAAIQLFNRNGYHATSMRDIAREVAIQKPSLYHHFDGKEDILLAILDAGMEQFTRDMEAIAASDDGCTTKLRAAIHAHARLIADNPDGAAVFLREDRGLGDAYLQHYVAQRDRVEQFFRAIVQQGIQEGVFRAADVTIVTHALLGMVNWMTRWYRPEGRLDAGQIADIFFDLFLYGIEQPARDA